MEYLMKLGIFTLLFAVVYGRALQPEECECDLRYHQHYAIKGCEVTQSDACGCPTSYSCPSRNETSPPDNVCMYNNVQYVTGVKIPLEDKCQICRCSNGINPRIFCIRRECPQLESVEGDNCHPVYEKNKCCPSKYECVSQESESALERTTAATCSYGNLTYPQGAKIYSNEDPCKVCFCDENWNGIDNSTCYLQECVFERSKHYLDAGCTPVYHESKCCPIEFYCPENHGRTDAVKKNGSDVETYSENERDFCIFAGSYYAVGDSLPTNKTCVSCSCQVPPDVTCVHQSCPPSPNPENCYEYYTADQCCPVYDCVLGDSSNDEENSTYTYNNTSCPTPMCADSSCVIGVLDGHECPTCICDSSRERIGPAPADSSIEPQYMEGGEGESERETSGGEKSFEVDDLESLSKVPPGESNEAEGGDWLMPKRETLSEAAIERIHEKEKNSLEHVQDLDSSKGEPKSAFQNAEEMSTSVESSSENANTTEKEVESLPPFSEIRRKRSEYYRVGTQYNSPNQWNVRPQQQQQRNTDYTESSERETEFSNNDNENYDEVKVFSAGEVHNNRATSADMLTLDAEQYNSVIWRTVVPGCPAPMCADSSCKIGIPPGWQCPTCVCKKRRQP